MHAAPFQPFVIRFADGNPARVPHPDFIALLDQFPRMTRKMLTSLAAWVAERED